MSGSVVIDQHTAHSGAVAEKAINNKEWIVALHLLTRSGIAELGIHWHNK